jgi:thioredoxin 1
MSKDSKSNLSTIGLVVVSLLVLAGIIYFAWGKTSPEPKGDSVNNTPSQQQADSAANGEAGKLGANEVQITAGNFKSEVEDAKGVVVIDAYAPWCPHCQKVAPILTELSNDYAGRAKFGKMNSDNQDASVKANFDFAVNNGLTGYPTVWIYKDGKKVDTLSGERTKDEYKTAIDNQLK